MDFIIPISDVEHHCKTFGSSTGEVIVMSRIYDNWERLVEAVIRREQLWQLCHAHSRSPSICSESSDFSFPSPLPDAQQHLSSNAIAASLMGGLDPLPNSSASEPVNKPELQRHASQSRVSRDLLHSKIYLEIKKRLKMRGIDETPDLSAIKSLVYCSSVSERNLLADTARIVERNKISKRKEGFRRKIVADGLTALGYNASICKSKWEKSPSFPAGEYEYMDVIIEGERLIIDMDFRSEFEIARSTKAYRLVLQTLPYIVVGKADRLEKIIGIVSEAAKHGLKKRGMLLPPWRETHYMKAKWLSPFNRIGPSVISLSSTSYNSPETELRGERGEALIAKRSSVMVNLS
ncbi:hypothetical protein Pfo_006365 [Paulownia fortunei]|nr:hypothetical protein Pfo_006365 [Paulownia fortunei]